MIIHIGFQRTMTTWLQKEIFNNPDLPFHIVGTLDDDDHKSRLNFLTDNIHSAKDVSEDLKQWAQADIMYAEKNGLIPVITNERLCGNPYSGSYDTLYIAHMLKKAFPQAKIIIGIREQISMIQSHWLRYVASGGYLKIQNYIVARQNEHKKLYPLFNLDTYSYDLIYELYASLFSPKNVLIQPFELFRKTPEVYIKRLEDFCNTPIISRVSISEVHNQNYNIWHAHCIRFINSFLGLPIYESRGFREKIRNFSKTNLSVFFQLTPTNLIKREIQNHKNVIQSQIGDHYAESNRNLSNKTGLDLLNLGYIN